MDAESRRALRALPDWALSFLVGAIHHDRGESDYDALNRVLREWNGLTHAQLGLDSPRMTALRDALASEEA